MGSEEKTSLGLDSVNPVSKCFSFSVSSVGKFLLTNLSAFFKGELIAVSKVL